MTCPPKTGFRGNRTPRTLPGQGPGEPALGDAILTYA